MSAKNKKRNSEVSIPLVNLPTGDLEDSKNKSMRSTKKGGMVSSETLREKQKYNKAIREDRRNTIDNRHQFIFSKLADALQVEINVVQDMVLIDENFDKIDNFFAVSGPNTISFIVQNKTSASPLKIYILRDKYFDYGKCYYFLKIVPEKPITHKNIVSDTVFGTELADQNILIDSIQNTIEKIMIPALQCQAIWGEKLNSEDLKVREFMDKLQNFVSNLSGANKNMTGHIELSSDSVNNYISNLESASEYQQSLTNSDNVEKIDKVLQQWNIQIEQVLAQSEQIRREADDVGPSAELQYWKNRMVQFNTLLQKMKNKNVKMVIILAHIAKLKSFNAWKIMDAKITDLANEANDNVKYLYTLEKYLIPLSKYDPTNMIIFLPNLIKVIRMIYTVSSYYNTSERMTSLFVKVTNQMIKTSKRYINFGVSRIWELSSDEMKKRMNDCIKLNEAYQEEFHKVKENLSELPNEKQFEFSENYIFGKIDTFCKRINLVLSLLDYIDSFSEIQNISIEGIDTIYLKYKSIVDMIKKKSYDFLDHRRPEFENDYGDMKNQFLNLKTLIHKFIDGWLQKSLSTEKSLILLKKFYIIRKDHLNLEDKYVKVFLSYGKDLELIKKIYMKLKNEPIVSHYLPPICGKITWSRLLYRRIEEPMLVFNKMPHILKISEANKVIKNYNKLAKILTEFELLYYRGWCRAIEISKKSLNSPILIKISENTFKVNFDIQIIELIKEARYLKEMKFKLSDTANLFISLESGIIKNYNNLNDLIIEHRTVVDSIPSTILILLKPYIHRIEEILLQGCDRLSWSSLNISNFLLNSRKSLSNLKKIVKNARDILECRIMEIFDQVSETELFSIQNEESMDTEEFAKIIMKSCHDIFDTICKKSQLAELAVFDLIDLLNSGLTESESKKMFQDNGQGVDNYNYTINLLIQKNTDSFIKCTRKALDSIKQRLINSKRFSSYQPNDLEFQPLFKSNIVLEIPVITVKPSIEEMQTCVNQCVQIILRLWENMPQWETTYTQNKTKSSLEPTTNSSRVMSLDVDDSKSVIGAKTIYRIISEHKDIVKIVIQLNSIIASAKSDILDVLKMFSQYSELWESEPKIKVIEFAKENPIISEFESKFRYYMNMEEEINEIISCYKVGPIVLHTDLLKSGLLTETKNWMLEYGKNLNARCSISMDETVEFFDNLFKCLSRPTKDLDDVRAHMLEVKEIRNKEISIDMTISPIEEAYTMLNKYEIIFDNAERVDSLSYGWSKLKTQATIVQNHLLEIQPKFKAELLQGVEKFVIDFSDFNVLYNESGPMVKNIAPREASDRLNIFQSKFDELWAKYQTYSGGEELFGLPVSDYPLLQKTKKELNLLQKLYQLYNNVIDAVNGYYDIAWVDIDIEKINTQLLDFQKKCRKLPKALKDWQASEDLRKTIDDFNETCPLLEMMSHKAMQKRHWDRITLLTNHTFDVESDTFLMKNLMEAPLLQNKDDIEDICISAVKERDIEAKLKQVINECGLNNIEFGNFKNRGELLLKGDSTSEIITLMEDSLMVLGSLLSNRYNVPFKPQIQEWVKNLTGTTEIIENWLIVQNLWIYLEAVFVGGDIAKQLPQEAKRFSNIDKTWIKIMQRAHENTNVIQCCVGDDTLSQLLPHLLEQLEICQKSLTGYLESKRLIFPRFFFVSDPALLEILGQASDSHTIQAHLLSVFDNTKSVKFDTNQYDKMLMIVSRENEEIQLDEFVMAQGGVELWLGELLAMTRKSVHSIIRSAYLQIFDAGFKLLEFEEEFPAQVGLLGLQFLWTRDAEIAIKNSRYDKKIMQQTNIHFNEILNSLIDLTTQELTKIARVKFETLITIHVHQKDIFEDLFKLHVRSIYDFEWLKQTRFYFKEDEDKCMISITDVNFSYQNEFLGCTDRLVITPLTDRCYITISQALGMSLGGAPAGPAGTGKTETVKDMGRCLGKYVVVFNCSDQMDYRGLGRIYKGLAQSGAWGCFDEFNRIDLPVLSVAAQQISIVLSSKKERKTQFIFTDGDVVELDPEFGLFLTMNPGYAGRQELPENLKVNFRTVAMMVPDRGIIIRVKLAACGFQQNVILAKKFFILYKLCEEQLSKQVHYDFGLRNILSVLRTLGANKRNNKNDSELVILMRDLRNMNLSKLVDEDEPLFISLIDDLFPGMTLEKMGYPNMEAAIDTQIKNLNLINHDPWVLKIIQLYETQNVRHGMMALGPSGSGKTNCISVLLKAMGDCGKPHREMRMNPKAITAPQMFGRLDVATNDWTDGIFSTMWRRTHKAKKGEHIWLILDGPVDAIWIENLNSVLDDNKTLTLANGDRISMAPNCKIVFEVHNIDNASPATVSRNGMVFMSSSIMNWDPILKGWLIGRPASQVAVIYSVFESIWEELYEFISTIVIPKMQILECMYIKQALSVLSGILPGGDEEKNILPNYLNRCIVFSLMWSLGALLELDDRKKMEDFIRSNPGMLELPPNNDGVSMFEYTVDSSGNWEHWSKRVSNYIYPKDSIPEYTSILVPNVDNVRTEYLIGIIAKQGKGLLLIGEQGTAKTVMIHGYCKNYDPEMHMYKSFNFSSASTPFMFQKTIESYIDKRMGSTYGPPAGKKMTVFIDDINMPTINEWEDQITNEIVRQTMEMHGFYSLEKPGEFTNIVDIQFMAAMIHPGGGRNDIPQRLKRHFCIFNSTIPSDSSIDKIFNTIGKGYFCEERGFSAEICNSIENLVVATRVIWQKIKIKMLPTPAKFHYIFNLRDLSRIWQGMLTVSSIVATEMGVMYNLWLHECTRVIADRFIDFSDKTWMLKCVKQVASEVIGNDISQHLAEEPYFCDFMRDAPEVTGEEGDDADFEAPKIYEMVETFEILVQRLYSFQSLYNESIRGAKMDMVFFRDAMTNLLKISRIIRTSKGHALLVGVGGSGKQSLSRLASFIAGYDIFQITLSRTYGVNNLMDDLKVLYRSAGQKGKPMTFLFTDNEIKDESFLEYMNNLLSSGEVSNLFARDEMDEILQDLIVPMKKEFPRRPPSNENLYGYYMSRVRNNLHVVLCFSPVGEKFLTRSLKFPGLISGCTMNWFQRWPKDALIAVSKHFLSSYEISCTDTVKDAVLTTMGNIQDMVSQVCTSYFERFRRRTHVTPKSYLSFLEGYKTIYSLKYKEIGILAERMYTGLKKLMEATDSINELSKDLVIKEKELAIASKNADLVLADVTVSAQAAEKVKAQVQKVKNKAQSLVDEISTDKVIAEKKLEVARPALEQAEAALQTIKPAHISTVRKLAKPPFMIMKIMDCVSILFQKRMDTVSIDTEKNHLKPSWGESLKLLGSSNFLQGLLSFPKDTINSETLELLLPYINQEDYTYNTAKNACGDVAGLLSWTKAMADFFMVNREVLPLKANLAIQEAKYNSAMVDLNEAQMKLDDKQKQLDEVQAKYDKAMSEKQTLIDDAESCRKKMSNATALIDGLSGEKIRWTESSKQFESQIHKLVGDVLIATGFLSYAGPFNQEYRSTMIDKWCREMTMKSIPFSDNLNVVDMLVDAPTIGEWNVEGLPNDELSIQNGLIVTSATRYPLLIDPQGQGKSWIKNRESNNELQLTNLNHKYFRTHLEECLSLGKPLLIEDVGEELDPVLDNILEKNFIKSGSNYKVKIGDKECDVMKNFRLYITTKRGNPSYSPEVSARTSIIDFTVTMKGLEDQLLSIVIFTEKKELESERTKLVNEVTLNKRKMKELEDNLLFRLTSTEGSLVEDESLIAVLRTTKITANEVNEKLSIAAETEIRINSAREEFRSVATRGSILYFFIVEIGMINNMYQTSLKQFLGIFNISIAISTKSPVNSKRIANIIETLTYESWRYLVRSLFEKDKFLSTVLITFKLEMKKGLVSSKEFSIFIKGGAALDLNSVEAKPKKWISDVVWLNLVELSSLPTFTQILSQVTNDDKSWKDWFDSDAPESTVLPDGYDNHLSLFHKLLLVRCWCPDRCIPMAKKYIGTTIGQKFVEGVALNLSELVDESNTSVPLICFLSMGSDPTESIERLAKLQNKSFEAISMGQGQEVHARRVINNAMSDGGWVLLQNCHLGLDYMEELMDVLTNVENAKPNFRCWLTTEEHPDFPINLLQMGIKYTAEPPGGMKAGLRRTYGTVSQDQLDIINVPQWKPLLYAVAFLHTVVQERRKFGPIGWNIPYEFNTSDLAASLQFVQNHLDDMDISKGVSWNTVRYMISEVQYGGRVTDDFDKRLLITYCKVWLGENIFNDSFNFYKGYVIPKCKSVDDYNNAIEKLPVSDHPEIFGLHSNADITYQTNTTSLMLQTIQSIQPKDAASGGGQTRESIVYQLASDVLEKLPEDYIFHMVKERLHKYGHLQPLNIFLRQEIDRMDRVIKSVRSTLNDLKLAIDGTIIMSENLMDALDNLFDARIPASWSKISWDGSTFGFWFTELVDRNAQFYSWIFVERPAAFWMTGFFNPQGFLTATKQEITRAHKGWSLDGVVLDNEVTKLLKEDINNPPSEGVYIYGLFIDGAGWDRRNMKLVEPPPKVLYTQLPVVHVFAINTSNKKGPPNYYECPVYKKPRRTDLKYIFNLLLKTSKESDHWVLRGVALLCDIK